MHTSLTSLTTVAALCTSVMALPHQKRLAESEPWHLSGLSVFTNSDGSSNSSISFDLVDNNAGLQADTTCSRSVPGSVEDANNFYPCDNSSFNFRWDGTTLRIQRFYTDTAVGPCPLYCSVTVYGNGTPDLALDYTSEAGKGTYQDSLDIFVTEMAA
ncbi:hypothetical protein E4T52_14365 [Aureobasidium sp. EXF-3400]|nr:hypothetical protein E4T51_13355 [Aureobasidium sp. EXF-12344]KAI4770629.1 hypothetical protein E4T52_14365 [Aureobasidium sp. EXF-3400]